MPLQSLNRWSFLSLATLAWLAALGRPAGELWAQDETVRLADGFAIDKIYQVPKEQGSWVSLTCDPRGRLIASDQYGNLYRVTPGTGSTDPVIESIPVPVGHAHGLLCAFDSLYVVAHQAERRPSGLYRVRDTNGDDVYDAVALLRTFEGSGEHGPHAVILSADGQSLLVCGGNHTNLPNPETTRVPQLWQEDQLLPRMPDPGGHAVGRMAPGGWICQTDPDGRAFELLSVGYRNQYDIALDPNGELFTYDADMEWDIGTPWYRPTRVCHATVGSEFGWRNGSYKWPVYYGDSLPGVVDIGPGSPTGIVFGTSAAFPAKYQQALFICDWSYGIIYAVHLTADGASYRGEAEMFCSAPALQAADIAIGSDGALYFVTGGRHTQSNVYRIRYVGGESTAPAGYPPLNAAAQLRRTLEAIESGEAAEAAAHVETCWPHLASADRWIRFAARTALEKQPPALWGARIATSEDPHTVLQSVMAVARTQAREFLPASLAALARLSWDSLDSQQRFDLLRDYALLKLRFPDEASVAAQIVAHVNEQFPSGDWLTDRELSRLLAAVDAPGLVPRVLQRLAEAQTQEDQMHFAEVLRVCRRDWTDPLRRQYFAWFLEAAKLYGGNSFSGYIRSIRNEAIAALSDDERQKFQQELAEQPPTQDPYAELKARPLVKQWTVDELSPNLAKALDNRNLENGQKLFALAQCYKCHRFEGQGGFVGPDLTGVGRRYSREDLLRSLIEPNHAVSDQYRSTRFTLTDGRTITGRIVNLARDDYLVQTDMMNPGQLTPVNVGAIEEQRPSEISLMPEGLLDTFSRDEIYDLLAYLRTSQGR